MKKKKPQSSDNRARFETIEKEARLMGQASTHAQLAKVFDLGDAADKAGAEEEARLLARNNITQPMVWERDQAALVNFFLDAAKRGKLKASFDADVYRMISQHFVDKNGNSLKPEQLRVLKDRKKVT